MKTPKELAVYARAILETVAETEGIPNGHLYAHLMGALTFDEYQTIIGMLKDNGFLKEKHHFLTIGKPLPKKAAETVGA